MTEYSIEERATIYAERLKAAAYCPAHDFGTGDYEPEEGLPEEEYTASLDGYIAGATDERKMLLELAVKAHCRLCPQQKSTFCSTCDERSSIRELMTTHKHMLN